MSFSRQAKENTQPRSFSCSGVGVQSGSSIHAQYSSSLASQPGILVVISIGAKSSLNMIVASSITPGSLGDHRQ